MGKFDTKHKVIFQPSLGKTASNSVLELFIRWKELDMKFDESLYDDITIYHDYNNIKSYQYIGNPADVTEKQFIELINIPVNTKYQIYKTHVDQLNDASWVYELLEENPSNFIFIIPVRHPYISFLRKSNDDYLGDNIINMLDKLYSYIDGDNIIPFPTDLLSCLSKNELQKELSFFFEKYLGIEFKWYDLYEDVFYNRITKQKNKKSELIYNEDIWNKSLPIIENLKEFGINYTKDLQNYNKFSFETLQ